jgi:hypothetical protein
MGDSMLRQQACCETAWAGSDDRGFTSPDNSIELCVMRAGAKSKWQLRQEHAELERLQMEAFTLALNGLFAALDRCLCPHQFTGFRADPIAVAHKLLNTLPVTRKVTQAWTWSDESRAKRQDAMKAHSKRMKEKYA